MDSSIKLKTGGPKFRKAWEAACERMNPYAGMWGELWSDDSVDAWCEQYKFVRDCAPKQFVSCWRPRFAKPYEKDENIYPYSKILSLFIDVLDADTCKDQLSILRALVATDSINELKLLSEKPGWFTKRRIDDLLGFATEGGHVESAAWLMGLRASIV